jgi:hypothetical protein
VHLRRAAVNSLIPDPYKYLIGLGLVAALIAGIWGYGKWQYSKGYTEASAKAAADVAKVSTEETQRQQEANTKATQEAYTTTIPRMLETQFDLQTILKENEDVPLNGDDACGGLGADSVRSLNRVRRPEAQP